MYNQTVHSIFHNLEKQSCNICTEVDDFMNSITEWADELGGTVEKELAAGKESAIFLLPKTPSEKKAQNKRGKNTINSECSLTNSTFLPNETTSNLDESISTRTRGARRAATSKISQLKVSKIMHETQTQVIEQESLIIEKKRKQDMSNATFVMPKTNTRTKPVLKDKQLEVALVTAVRNSEPPESQNEPINASPESSEQESPLKKIHQKATPSERPSRRKISLENPIEQQNKCNTPVENHIISSTGHKTSTEKQEKESSVISILKTPPERASRKKTSIKGSNERKPSSVVNETPVDRLTRRKNSRALSGSPVHRTSSRKMFRTLSGSPVVLSNSFQDPRSPKLRSSNCKSKRSISPSPAKQDDRKDASTNQVVNRSCMVNNTVTIVKESTPNSVSTYIVVDETWNESAIDDERTPVVKKSSSFSKEVSTPAKDLDKTPIISMECVEMNGNTESENIVKSCENLEVSKEADISKKKRKHKKDEDVKENIVEVGDNVRITRTKSKAIKQMIEDNETKQADLSAFAKKLVNRAKLTSLKKNQLAALLECNSSTPKNRTGHNNLPFGNLISASKSKYHLLLSSSKALKTPLSTLPNSAVKTAKLTDKVLSKPKTASRDSSVESMVKTASKPQKTDKVLEREMKLKSKKEKEEEAALKRQNVIKSKQEELKRKNELKYQMALKQREKLEQEKYNNMIQSEKEKEERHKLILQERQIKLKEEVFKKKMLTQQKIAETGERRRMEEEARIAKLKEMEAEEQRLALEKQKEQERQEKRAQERLAQKKAREEYELQLKQELEAERLKAEKLMTAKKGLPSASKMQSASKIQSANKRQKFNIVGEKLDWDYKPRHEDDYGLEDEHSEVDSEDEKYNANSKPPLPWGKKVLHGKSPAVKVLTLEMLCEFMSCYRKSPDVYKMFKMTPSKRIKRSSSVIWNTPSS